MHPSNRVMLAGLAVVGVGLATASYASSQSAEDRWKNRDATSAITTGSVLAGVAIFGGGVLMGTGDSDE